MTKGSWLTLAGLLGVVSVAPMTLIAAGVEAGVVIALSTGLGLPLIISYIWHVTHADR